jgi:hypothetical protein
MRNSAPRCDVRGEYKYEWMCTIYVSIDEYLPLYPLLLLKA